MGQPKLLLDQKIAGVATGSIYGLVALAIVLIYRSTDVMNFAQGEMALLVTFVGCSLIQADVRYVLMFLIVLALAGALGAFVELTVIRPVENAPVLNIVIVTLGLFTIFNSLALFIWGQGQLPKSFPATPIGSELNTFDFQLFTLRAAPVRGYRDRIRGDAGAVLAVQPHEAGPGDAGDGAQPDGGAADGDQRRAHADAGLGAGLDGWGR